MCCFGAPLETGFAILQKKNNSDGNIIVNLSEQKNHRVVISFTRFLFYTVFVISSSPLLLIEDDGENKVANLHI